VDVRKKRGVGNTMRSEDGGEVYRISMLVTKMNDEIEAETATRIMIKTEVGMTATEIRTDADVETRTGPPTTTAIRIEGIEEGVTMDDAIDIEKTIPAV